MEQRIDWEALEKDLLDNSAIEPIVKATVIQAIPSMMLVDVPKFTITKTSKWDMAYMMTKRIINMIIPVAGTILASQLLGVKEGLAVGSVLVAGGGIFKGVKEAKQSNGKDPGTWDLLGKLLWTIFQLVKKLSSKKKEGGK